MDDHFQRTECAVRHDVGFEYLVHAGKVNFAFGECNSVKTGAARDPYRRSRGKAVGTDLEHQNITLLTARYIKGAIRADGQDSRVPDILRKLFKTKPVGNVELVCRGRPQFERLEDVTGDFHVGKMLGRSG